MADVSVYKKATVTYAWVGGQIRQGDIRLATDAAPLANPGFWATVTDAEMTSGKKGFHDD